MYSTLPKVLHRLGGKTLLEHVLHTAYALNTDPAAQQAPIVIFGHEGEKVQQALTHLEVTWVHQTEQLGTGHAVMQALPHIPDNHPVLILYGDVPLISPETLNKFISNTPRDAIGILTANYPNPTGLGRIIRDQTGKISQIIEEKDATDTERMITEVNSGIYLIPAGFLKKWLPTLKSHNAQQEYYLTDIISIATQENRPIYSMTPSSYEEILGINDRIQLSQAERYYQLREANKLMRQGVTLADPARLDIRGDLTVGRDVFLDINIIIEGRVAIGNHCIIGPHTVLRNVVLGDHVTIHANSVIEGAEIAEKCIIGPFARIRPGSQLAASTHIGNFVEIKNSTVGTGSKINHLTYIGDSEIGKHVNIGAGTITCNYDGANKHRTIIGDQAFIGSATQLIAPVTIGEGATIGAGSTITRFAPPHQLTLCRTTQRTIENWQRPKKEEL
jgi:bifunctional UDP-N-acetylglucosamine pyrophosphorylase/glucosamine-1-phosphate N-acetyltransferase